MKWACILCAASLAGLPAAGVAEDFGAGVSVSEAPATEATTAPEGFQVVRLGDSNLSCESLMGEINTLSNEAAAAGYGFDMSEMMPSGGMGMGMGGMGVGLLSSFDPTGISGMVAGQAMAAKAQADAAAQQKKMEEQFAGMNEKIALQQKQQARVQHLQSIFVQKQC